MIGATPIFSLIAGIGSVLLCGHTLFVGGLGVFPSITFALPVGLVAMPLTLLALEYSSDGGGRYPRLVLFGFTLEYSTDPGGLRHKLVVFGSWAACLGALYGLHVVLGPAQDGETWVNIVRAIMFTYLVVGVCISLFPIASTIGDVMGQIESPALRAFAEKLNERDATVAGVLILGAFLLVVSAPFFGIGMMLVHLFESSFATYLRYWATGAAVFAAIIAGLALLVRFRIVKKWDVEEKN